jgi:tRNA-(ms[2]io[6]A)-hydroxylase
MLLWREKLPDTWLAKIRANLASVPVDHAHLERKAATSALKLEKYVELLDRVSELNAIAIEELQHFRTRAAAAARAGHSFHRPAAQPVDSGMMAAIRKGRRQQVIDHLVACALIEGRSCEKFQILADGVRDLDPGLAISTRAWSRAKATTTPLISSWPPHRRTGDGSPPRLFSRSRCALDPGAESVAAAALRVV